MESLIAKALPGADGFIQKGWFAAMGFFGLLLLVALLLFGTPYDPALVASVAVALLGIGFGEAECRARWHRRQTINGVVVTTPCIVWRATTIGVILHIIGWSGFLFAVVKTALLLI